MRQNPVMDKIQVVYQASPTLSRFHRSKLFYRGIVGPVGSGKSTSCCMEIMSRALRQARGPDGIRRTRWVVVRNTYGELKDTTLVTWLMWFGESIFGPFAKSEMTHRLEFKDVSMEVMFRALDRPDHVAKRAEILGLDAPKKFSGPDGKPVEFILKLADDETKPSDGQNPGGVPGEPYTLALSPQ